MRKDNKAKHTKTRTRERPKRFLAIAVASATLVTQVVGVTAMAADPSELKDSNYPVVLEITDSSENEDQQVEQPKADETESSGKKDAKVTDGDTVGDTENPVTKGDEGKNEDSSNGAPEANAEETPNGDPEVKGDESSGEKQEEESTKPEGEQPEVKNEESSNGESDGNATGNSNEVAEEQSKESSDEGTEEKSTAASNEVTATHDTAATSDEVNAGKESDVTSTGPKADPSNQPTTSEGVSTKYDITFEDGVFKIYYDIGEDVDGDVTIDLSEVIDEINEYYRQVTGDKDGEYTCVPADSNKFDIEITTSNGHTYRYKDGSFRLETADTSNAEKLTDFVGFDGQKLSVESIGAIAKSEPMQKLFGVSSSSKVKLNHVLNMYSYLEQAGYTGETALTDYLLDYYNEKLGSNYENFTDLAKEHPESVVNMQGGMADDQYSITEEQYNKLLEEYPDYFGKYSIVMKHQKNGNVLIQMKWPEEEIASASYELFYKELLSFYFGDKEGRDEFADGSHGKWNDKDMGLKDYMDNTNEVWSKVNDYMKQATAAGLNKDEASKLAISMAFGIDGPWTNNSYQGYKYNWYNSITLEQVDGDITINKVDSDGNLIKDPATFQLYYYKIETVDDKEQKVTYYYAINENGEGYFTTDESKAAALITEDGSCKVKYLLPDYQYYLRELQSPDGYETIKEDIAFNVVSKEDTTINVINKLIEVVPDPKPEPKPDPDPDPDPKPEPDPEPTPNPEPVPEPVPNPDPIPEPVPETPVEVTTEPEPEKETEVVETTETTKPQPTSEVYNPQVPKTGNASSNADVAMLLISIAGIGTLVYTKKTKKN